MPHEGRESVDLTHRVLSWGLNQSGVSALEAAEAPPCLWLPALITAFWTGFLFGSWGVPSEEPQIMSSCL